MQVESIVESLTKKNVRMDLLPSTPSQQVDQCSSLWKDNCTIKRRVTMNKLTENYAKMIGNAQRNYLEKLTEAEEYLIKNVQMVSTMDSVLGCEGPESEDSSEESIKKAADGTILLHCPFLGCCVKTFKLKRRLQLKHRKETDATINYALHAARQMEKNKCCIQVYNPEHLTVKHLPMNKTTNLVNRRRNRKKCLLCSKPCINMGEHVSSVHKIARNSEEYKKLVKSAPVIPPCYLKKAGGKVEILEGQELEEAKKINESEIAVQSSTLDKLKTLRGQMEQISDQIAQTEEIEEYRALKNSLREVENEYKTLRYQDSRQYSTTTKKWRDSFFLFWKRGKITIQSVHVVWPWT